VTAAVLGNATVEGGLACVFYGPSAPTPTTPNAAQADSVRVVVVKGTNALTWYNDYKSKVSAQPISGYGDQAYYDGYASLSVLKGDYYLRIAVSPAGAAPSLSDEEQLATAILPKL
jgi:lipopolysaccharide export system protein LptA